MIICHTADLHIRRDAPERLEALTAVLSAAADRGAELVVIAGDLFDRESDVRATIADVRERLAAFHAPIVLSSGNHDAHAYSAGAFFGEHVSVLGAEPLEHASCCITSIPFDQSLGFERLGERIRAAAAAMPSGKASICLFHGELVDSFFTRGELGDEGERRYMPARLSYFRDAGFDYVLAGHFHAAFNVWEYAEQCYFCYPGSPVAITSRELGKRAVNIFELGEAPKAHYLDTPRVEQCALTLSPFDKSDPATLLKESCGEPEGNVRLLIEVDGFVDGAALGKSERDIAGEMDELLAAHTLAGPPRYRFQEVGAILGEPLFQAFEQRLRSRGLSAEEEAAVWKSGLRAFMAAPGASAGSTSSQGASS